MFFFAHFFGILTLKLKTYSTLKLLKLNGLESLKLNLKKKKIKMNLIKSNQRILLEKKFMITIKVKKSTPLLLVMKKIKEKIRKKCITRT